VSSGDFCVRLQSTSASSSALEVFWETELQPALQSIVFTKAESDNMILCSLSKCSDGLLDYDNEANAKNATTLALWVGCTFHD
jgi:hypothetical protein